MLSRGIQPAGGVIFRHPQKKHDSRRNRYYGAEEPGLFARVENFIRICIAWSRVVDSRWTAPVECSRPRCSLPVRLLSCRFGRLYLPYLERAYTAGELRFRGQPQHFSDPANLSADEFLSQFLLPVLPQGLPADSSLWSFQQPAPCGKPGSVPRTPRCFGSCGIVPQSNQRFWPVTTGLLRRYRRLTRQDAAMPVLAEAFLSPRSVQSLSRPSSTGRRAKTWCGFGSAKACPYRSEDAVFLSFPHTLPAPGVPAPPAPAFAKHILRAFPISRYFLGLPLPYSELPKHPASGIPQRLSTVEF
jgi:hypothetical protein